MILKIKSIIYRYTGVYLAHREESDYVYTQKYKNEFIRIANNEDNDMSLVSIHGLLIGLWQLEHGFTRPVSFLRFKRPRLFFRIIAWFVDFFTVCKWDLEKLFKNNNIKSNKN